MNENEVSEKAKELKIALEREYILTSPITKAMILKARQTGINRRYSEDDLLRIFKKGIK